MFVLPDIGEPDDAARLAEKVIERIAKAFGVEGHELRVTASVGVALFPDDGEDVENLLRNADAAL